MDEAIAKEGRRKKLHKHADLAEKCLVMIKYVVMNPNLGFNFQSHDESDLKL